MQVADIINVVTECSNDAWGENKLRRLVEMLSVTSQALHPERPKLTEDKLLSCIKQAALRHGFRRPRKVSVQRYFDICLLFELIRSKWPSNDALSFADLRNKLLCLLALDLMARSSDLASIFADGARVLANGKLEVKLYWTKENKKSSVVVVEVDAYPEDKSICSVTTAQAYLKMLESRKLEPDRSRHSEDGVKPTTCLFISQYPNKSKRFPSLTSNRIGSILKSFLVAIKVDAEWTAHCFRGASTSKLVNLGVSKSRVLAVARWADDSTFDKHYFRPARYAEMAANNNNSSFSALLRMRTTDA